MSEPPKFPSIEPAESTPPSGPVDETDPVYIQRRMLKFRSWHRGTKECDLLLGTFADRHVDGFTPEQLDRYQDLLQSNDPELFDWAIGRAPVPPELDTDVMRMLLAHRFLDTAK